ncbi:MAG: hypothetical protein UFG06_10800 [Lachnospiraceae bacterium]|nr:hypothetical protein [Lachnospiraceae bacterium]
MKKLFSDMVDNSCTSVFVKGAEIIPAGSTVYVMSAKERNAEYEIIAENFRDLFDNFSVWKERKQLYVGVQFFDSKDEAMKNFEFINMNYEQNKFKTEK